MKIISESNALIATDDDGNIIGTAVAGVNDPGFIQGFINAGYKEIEVRGHFVAATPGFVKFADIAGIHISGRASFENISILFANVNDISVRDISFTGSTAYGFISLYNCNDVVVERVKILNPIGSGFGAIHTQIPDNTTNRNHYYNDCIVTDGNKHGFVIWGDDYRTAIAENFHYNRCEAHRCGLANSLDGWTTGFNLSEAITANRFVVTDCKATYCWESGFHMEGRGIYNDVTFSRCLAEHNGQKPDPDFGNGFLVGGVRIVDCTSKNNRGVKWGTGCGIRVLASQGAIICSGNITSGNSNAGIYVDSGKGPCSVVANLSTGDAYGLVLYGPEDNSGLLGSVIQGNIIKFPTTAPIITPFTPSPLIQGNYIIRGSVNG